MHNINNNKDTVLKSSNGEALSALYHIVQRHNLHGSIPIEEFRMPHMRHILQELNSISPTLLSRHLNSVQPSSNGLLHHLMNNCSHDQQKMNTNISLF